MGSIDPQISQMTQMKFRFEIVCLESLTAFQDPSCVIEKPIEEFSESNLRHLRNLWMLVCLQPIVRHSLTYDDWN